MMTVEARMIALTSKIETEKQGSSDEEVQRPRRFYCELLDDTVFVDDTAGVGIIDPFGLRIELSAS